MVLRTSLRPGSLLLVPVLLLAAALASGCDDASAGAAGDHAAIGTPDTVPIYRIGSVEGGSWEAFSRIVSTGFDARGYLYLLDADARSVTVVDPDGQFVRTVGRGGDGPGEFRMPMAMAVLPDGRLAVADAGHRAMLLFGADGEYARAVPFEGGVPVATLLHPDGQGGVVYAARGMAMGGPGMRGPGQRMGAGAAPADIPIHRVALLPDGAAEVVHRAWLPPAMEPNVTQSGGGVMMRRALRAFEPQLHLAVLPDGSLAVADSTSYRIRIVGPDGRVARTIERPVAPRVVTDREREREKARRFRELEEGGSGDVVGMMAGPGGAQTMAGPQVRSMLEAQLEDLQFWPEIPVIQRLAADREGRLWVRRFGDIGEPGPLEILSTDGTLLATVPPGGMEIPAAFGPDGLAAWIERDDLDVQFVRVARVTDLP